MSKKKYTAFYEIEINMEFISKHVDFHFSPFSLSFFIIIKNVMFTVLSDFDCDCTVYITQNGYMAASFYCSFFIFGKSKIYIVVQSTSTALQHKEKA